MAPGTSGDAHLDRYEIHKRFRNRLERAPFVEHVRAKPSPMRPTRLLAAIDAERWFEGERRPGTATLEVEWRPRDGRDRFRIQYAESDGNWSCGWHQDGTHDDLGPNHFQVDREGWAEAHREPCDFDDPNPMAILEYSLLELERRVPELPQSAGSGTPDSG